MYISPTEAEAANGRPLCGGRGLKCVILCYIQEKIEVAPCAGGVG